MILAIEHAVLLVPVEHDAVILLGQLGLDGMPGHGDYQRSHLEVGRETGLQRHAERDHLVLAERVAVLVDQPQGVSLVFSRRRQFAAARGQPGIGVGDELALSIEGVDFPR